MQRTNRITARAMVGFALSTCFVSTAAFSQTSAAAYATDYRYSTGGQPTGVIRSYSGSGPVSYLASRNTYDPATGLLSKVESGSLSTWPGTGDPASWSNFTVYQAETYGYDSMGRMLWRQLSSGGVAYELTQHSYDTMGRQQCVATRMNPTQFTGSLPGACTLTTQGTYGPDRITKTAYDATNRPLSIQRAFGTPLQETYKTITYTPNHLPQTLTDADGNLTTNTYDGLDRVSKMQFPSETTPGVSSTTDFEQYTYDANSNRKTLLTRDSQTISYTYDNLNRMTTKQWPSSWGVSVYSGYDLRNLLLYANYTSATGKGVTNTYDGFGHIYTQSVNLGSIAQTMTYQYDADGNRTQVNYPGGNYIKYTYDQMDRLGGVLESGSTTLAAYSYDTAGRLQQLARGGGVTTTAYGYDPVSRLNSLSHSLATSLDNVSFSPFGYNPDNQITNVSVSNAEYDPLAKSATQSYTPNGLNQYSAVGGTSFSWDPRGNLTSDGATTYTYDLENRLTGASGTYNASLSYDPLGRLYQTTSGSAVTTFVYDGDRITAEYDGSGNILRRYAYGPAGDNPIAWYEGSGVGQANRRYLHSDYHGSIIAITDSTGVSLAVNQYDPYGLRNSQNQGRFQYTGQAYIPELGLHYYKARMYNAALGRFMQTDPIGYRDDLNLYTYASDDPVNRMDVDGNFSYPWHFAITLAAALSEEVSLGQSVRYAWQAFMADVGTQGLTAEDAAQHAMSVELPNGEYETEEQAMQMNADLVSSNVAADKLGTAAHAIQDRFPWGHEGFKLWQGFNTLGFWGTLKHIFTDTLPAPKRVEGAYAATREMFRGRSSSNRGPKSDDDKPKQADYFLNLPGWGHEDIGGADMNGSN